MNKVYSLRPLGFIQTPFQQKFGTPRQNGLVTRSRGFLTLDPELCPPGCLDDLEGFSHIWLIFGFHKNRPANTNGKVHPPRLNGNKVGLFASRTPHRPNPVGMSLVKLENVDTERLELQVSGLDLVDGTPVFDIKPYIQAYDAVGDNKEGWVHETDDPQLQVFWESSQQGLTEEQIQLIEEVLQRDLRNRDDKDKDLPGPFKTLIQNFDLWFYYREKQVVVQDIRFKR